MANKNCTLSDLLLFSKEEPCQLNTKKDLADFLGIATNRIIYPLYQRRRSSYYHKFEINKANGKTRVLHAVSGELKILQRVALDKLYKHYHPSFYAHGFTKDKSIITNAKIHRRKKLIIKVDLQDFFPSIHFGRVQGMFMGFPFNFGKEAAIVMAQLSCLDDESGCLPQGGVLSPYVANMICRRMDKRLASLAEYYHCHFTRYADDMTFSTNDVSIFDKKITDEFLQKIKDIVVSEKFAINEDKTKILTRKDRQVVTGIVVNKGLNVNRKYIRNIRATIYNCEKKGVKNQIIKPKLFKDNRNSRIPQNIDNQNAEVLFLKHLLGKILFFGDVVLSGGQDESNRADDTTYRRVQTYENLLWRFFKLKEVEKTKNKEVRKYVTRIAKVHIRNRPRLKEKLNVENPRGEKKWELLNKHRLQQRVKERLNVLSNLQTDADFCFFVDKMKDDDFRFYSKPFNGCLKDKKQCAKDIIQYPAVNREKVEAFLKSFSGTEDLDLKWLVHSPGNNEEFSIASCRKILLQSYYTVYYFLPEPLRGTVDEWVQGFDQITSALDENTAIDPISHPELKKYTASLKKEIGFSSRKPGMNDLNKYLESLRKNKIKKYPDIKLIRGKVDRLTTHVKSIESALSYIFNSMTQHSKSEIETIISGNEIIIKDASGELEVGLEQSRKFANGDLKTAAENTYGFCRYVVEATCSSTHHRWAIDMHTGHNFDPKFNAGFAHRLIFDKDLCSFADNSIKCKNTDVVAAKVSETKKNNDRKRIFLLDNHEEDGRLSDITELIESLGYEVDSRTCIEQPFEAGNYDIYLVHEGNKETEDIRRKVDSKKLAIFSGEYMADYKEYNGITYVNAKYLYDDKQLGDLLDKVLHRCEYV